MPSVKILFASFVTVLSVFGCFYISSVLSDIIRQNPPDTNKVLTILKSENLDFLVRRRQLTQVVIIRTASTSVWDWVPYVGDVRESLKDDGVLTANVKIYYGFNMDKLTTAPIIENSKEIQLLLPDPEVLDFAVDLDSVKFRSLKTGIITRFKNGFFNNENLKDKLQKQIKTAVEEFVSTPGGMPTKAELIKEMGGFERIFNSAYNVQLKFI